MTRADCAAGRCLGEGGGVEETHGRKQETGDQLGGCRYFQAAADERQSQESGRGAGRRGRT